MSEQNDPKKLKFDEPWKLEFNDPESLSAFIDSVRGPVPKPTTPDNYEIELKRQQAVSNHILTAYERWAAEERPKRHKWPSQAEFAKHLHVSQPTLSNWTIPRQLPSIQSVDRLVKYGQPYITNELYDLCGYQRPQSQNPTIREVTVTLEKFVEEKDTAENPLEKILNAAFINKFMHLGAPQRQTIEQMVNEYTEDNIQARKRAADAKVRKARGENRPGKKDDFDEEGGNSSDHSLSAGSPA